MAAKTISQASPCVAMDAGAALVGATKRLLIVSTVSATVKAFLLPYADHFRSLGWKVDAMARGIETCSACRPHFDEVYDIEWSRRPLDYRNLMRAIRAVRAVVASEGYDIVHVHTPVAAFITRMALAWHFRGKRPAVIYTAHGFHFQPGNNWLRNLVFAALEQTAGRWTDFLVTINRTDELAALRLGLVPPDRLRYMPGIGIDRDRFHATAVSPAEVEASRRRFGIGNNEPAFVMIAEFIPRKRHQDAVTALSRMRNKDAHIIFVGEGPRRGSIERQAADSGVLDRVHFAGSQDDVRPFILAARACILPSSQEGLPRSVMEALSCGVPVIGSDIRGTRDLLADGSGLLFPAGDVSALASRLDWFVDNPEKALEMGARARGCMARYETANIVALHEELYATAVMDKASEPCEVVSKGSRTRQIKGPILAIVAVDVMAWVLLRPWLEGLRSAGFEVHIACARGKYYEQLAKAGYTMHAVRFRRTLNIFAHIVPFFELIAILRSGGFQIINTHSPVAAGVGRLAAAFASVEHIIYTVHGFHFHDRMPLFLRNQFIALEWFFGRWTDAFMFLSDEDRHTAERLGICGVNARVCTIYNGVDVEIYHPPPHSRSDAFRIQHGLPDRPIIGIVGRIVKEKGYREFLEMAIALTESGVDVTYLVVGDSLPSDRDQFGPKLRAQVRKANLADRFVFTGMIDQVPDYLRLMDIFVLPSYREGFPRSILEAMATGLPVVATDIRGSREAVVDGVTGYIVPPRDARALRTAVESLLVDPARRKTMGDQGRLIACDRYDFRKVREQFVTFVQAVSKDGPGFTVSGPILRLAALPGMFATLLIVLIALYIIPDLMASLLAPHFRGAWAFILLGDALGCTVIGFLIGWRWAGVLYFGLSAIESICVATGVWSLGQMIWFSNLVPMIVVGGYLIPLLVQARNWRRLKHRPDAGIPR